MPNRLSAYDRAYALKAAEMFVALLVLTLVTYLGCLVNEHIPEGVAFALCSVLLLCSAFAPMAFWWARDEDGAEGMLEMGVKIGRGGAVFSASVVALTVVASGF